MRSVALAFFAVSEATGLWRGVLGIFSIGSPFFLWDVAATHNFASATSG
jgi:hypothetical protein